MNPAEFDTAFAETAAAPAPPPLLADGPSGSVPGHDEEATPPAKIPGYKLLRFVGRGSFGAVWLALQENTGKQVAIKFYRPGQGVDWAQLRREVRILADLYTAREVVQLLEVDWESDPPYFVMEYLEHGSLEDRLRRGPLPAGKALRIFLSVTRALAQAHGRGILHCDLKPANVLLDGQMRPRLADFGQSRLSNELSPSLGTFFYMAPEQAHLEALPDARWDVYALGAILFAMVTGEPPYKTVHSRRTLQSSCSLLERLDAYREILAAAPPLLQALRQTQLDAGMREIVARCLALDPAERYQSVQAVLEALEAHAARRARRPLLILGAVGPALLLCLMSLVGWHAARLALGASTATITERARESCRFAARFAAETASREIDRRWTVLEQAAADESLRSLLTEIRKGAREPRQHPQTQAALQRFTEDTARRHARLAATSWFVDDAIGMQWARTPPSQTTGQNWAFRDYFHGLGHDLQPNQVPAGIKPIQEPHRSVVFRTRASGTLIVAFSVPVWNASQLRADEPREVLGVLGMTVELGRFGELYPAEERPSAHQVAVLIDSHADWMGQRGLVLQHPALSSALARRQPAPIHHLPLFRMNQLERLQHPIQAAAPLEFDASYVDPVLGVSGGRFLAAAEPVLARGQDIGWVVVVEEPYAEVTSPVQELERRLVRIGGFGLFGMTLLFLLLWRLASHHNRPAL